MTSAAITIHVDNQRCMKIAKNPIFQTQTKHIEAHYCFNRKNKISREIMFTHVASVDQLADIF